MVEGTIFDLGGTEYTVVYSLNENEKNYILVSSGEDSKTLFDIFEYHDEDATITKLKDENLKKELIGKFILEGMCEITN